MDLAEKLLSKIEENKEVVGIIGLGYVGLPLAVNFAKSKVKVIGIDKSEEKVVRINSGDNYVEDISDEDLKSVVNSKYLKATTDETKISNCDVLIICVPTPLDEYKKPNMNYIQEACLKIASYMKPGVFISLESTTYPSTTEELVLPILERESGFKQGVDFWLAYSPERVDPGNKHYNTHNTPKVLGSISSEGLRIGEKVYYKAVSVVYKVSSPRVAEMVKILENTYRLVNISLINEMALLSGKMGIDIWEVIEAAKTKPFGFRAFYPGPGIGGHCIPLDPFYLEHIAKRFNFDLTMINNAGHINMRMPHYMSIKIATALNSVAKSINGSRVLFLGVAYKENISDYRESPALEIIDIIHRKKGVVLYHDPYIEEVVTPKGLKLKSVLLTEEKLNEVDCVVITTKHNVFNSKFIQENSKIIVDLRNLINSESSNVFKL